MNRDKSRMCTIPAASSLARLFACLMIRGGGMVFVINTDGWHTSIPNGLLSDGEDLVTDSPRLSYALPDIYDSLKLDCR